MTDFGCRAKLFLRFFDEIANQTGHNIAKSAYLPRERLPAAFICALVLLLLWISAAVYAVIHPNRGLHDRLAGTWVVRR